MHTQNFNKKSFYMMPSSVHMNRLSIADCRKQGFAQITLPLCYSYLITLAMFEYHKMNGAEWKEVGWNEAEWSGAK